MMRLLLKTLMIFFSCIAIMHLANAGLVRSSIGGRSVLQEAGCETTYSALDYSHDGLEMMFDGIENAGYGLHDDTSAMELITGYRLVTFIGRQPMFSSKAWTNGCAYVTYPACKEAFENILGASIITCEYCLTLSSRHSEIGGPRFVFRNSALGSNDRQLCQYSINRYADYWNIATRALDGSSEWNTTPSFAYGTGHSVAVIADRERKKSILYVDGRFIREKDAYTDEIDNIVYNNGKPSLHVYWTGIFSGFEAYCCRFYSRRLDDKEIMQHYMIDKARFDLP